MKGKLSASTALGVIAAIAALAIPRASRAQFQSCNYCDVSPFTPDPLDLNACDTGTLVLQGKGFQSTGVDGCSVRPTDELRSTRTDRLVIVAFKVLSDTQIQFSYQVPCTASTGIVGIDVTIDDDPTDSITPYACGNARILVHAPTLAVSFGESSAVGGADGVELRWRTLSEDHTLGFTVWARSAAGIPSALPRLVEAGAPGGSYRFHDGRAEAIAGGTEAYRVVEIRDDGQAGDGTGWIAVERAGASSGGRGRGHGLAGRAR